jgi:F-type H+-transporting ATPase subunit delta
VRIRAGSARRYADALFLIAHERGTEEAWAAELHRVGAVLRDESAARLLTSPRLTLSQKRDLLESTAGPFSRETSALVVMLLERGKPELLPTLAESFADRVREAQGIDLAEVTTAVALGAGERSAVEAWLQERTGRRIEMQTRVDPSILGGVVARVGDQLIDASVRGRLEALRRRLRAHT